MTPTQLKRELGLFQNTFRGLVVLLITTICLPMLGQQPDQSDPPDLFFSNGDVFDGTKKIASTNVLVSAGKISAIGTDVVASEGARVIDCKGKTLIPGLIDSHVHTFFDAHLKQAVLFGVTTELDMMAAPKMVAAWRSQQKDGQADNRADIFSAGAAVTVPKGHGTQFGIPVPTLDAAENAATFVNERVREGSDYIKIIYEDGKAFGMDVPTLTPKMLENSIVASKAANKMAVAHIGSQRLAKDAVKYGIDGLVHLFADSKADGELIEAMKQRGIFVSPTLVVISNTSGESTSKSLTKDKELLPLLNNNNLKNLAREYPVRPGATNSWKDLSHNVKTLHEAGITILAGTDAPNPGTVHGASMHHELELLVKCGLTPTAALASATSLPAKAYGLSDRGEIAVGKRADLFVVEGDPTTDIKHTRKIAMVFKNGQLIDRSARLEQVIAEKEKASKPSDASAPKLISDFEDGKVTAEFGAGWAVSTDTIMGGESTAEMKVVDDGANSKSGLEIRGDVQQKQPAFAGVMFSPGTAPMQPANVSDYKKLTFWSKCDSADENGKRFVVMAFFQKRGFQPSIQPFTATSDWQKHSVAISDFDGCDGTDVIGFWFGTNAAGEFDFKLDSISLDPK